MSGHRGVVTRGKLRFLKVLMPGFLEKLEIPPEFAKHIADEENDGFNLSSPLKKSWHVRVLGESPNLYFGDGWPEFVHDHELQIGYFLIFCYEGPKQFGVQILDHSSCDKDYSHRFDVDSVLCREDVGSTLQETFKRTTGNVESIESEMTEKHISDSEHSKIQKRKTDKFTHTTNCDNEYPQDASTSYQSSGVDDKYSTQGNDNHRASKEKCAPEYNLIDDWNLKKTGISGDKKLKGSCNGEELEGLLSDDSGAIDKGADTSPNYVVENSKNFKISAKEYEKHGTIFEEDAEKTTSHKRIRRKCDRDGNCLKKTKEEGSCNGEELEGLLSDDSGTIDKGADMIAEGISPKNAMENSKDFNINAKEYEKHDTIIAEDAEKTTNRKRIRRKRDQDGICLKKTIEEGSCNGEELEGLLSDDSGAIDKGADMIAEGISPKNVMENSKDSNINAKEYEKHGTIIAEDAEKTTSRKRVRRKRDRDGNCLKKTTEEGSCNGEELEGLLSDDSGAIDKGADMIAEGIGLNYVVGNSKDCNMYAKEYEKHGTIIDEDAKKSTRRKRIRRKCSRDGNCLKKTTEEGVSIKGKRAPYRVTLKPNNLEGHYYLYVPVNFKKATGISQENKLILRDPRRKLWEVDVQHSTKNRTLLVRGWKEFCTTNKLRPGDDCEFRLANDSTEGEKILEVSIIKNSKEYRKQAIKVQKTCGTITSGIPSFWVKASPNQLYRSHLLQIPNAFTATFDISQKQHVLLKDQKGKLFSTMLIHTTRKRTVFGRGWINFAAANNVKVDDVCEFRPDPNFSTNSIIVVNVLRKSCVEKGSDEDSSSSENFTIHDPGFQKFHCVKKSSELDSNLSSRSTFHSSMPKKSKRMKSVADLLIQ